VTLVHRVLPVTPFDGLDDYRAAGGGRAVESARRVEPDALITTVEDSGLRGRGGAGFPTGAKWRTIAANRSPELPTTVVVNGAEGEPGTFKDRTILRANPYAVIEGAVIAALAVGATDIVVALKDGDSTGHRRVDQAITEMRGAGLLADLPVSVVTGPHHYLFGEETALLEVVAGRPPFPRIAPPYRRGVVEVVEGDEDVDEATNLSGHVEMAGPGPETVAPPALVDNVETLANVPGIVAHGPAWFRELGTPDSPGTIVCTVTGDVRLPGVGEVPLGTSVAAAIDTIGGGPAGERPLKAVLNGVSATPLPPALLDTPLTYEDMAGAGSGLGTASLIVVGGGTDMTAVAAGAARFLAIESCGQCTPCKSDGLALTDALERLCAGAGGAADLDGVAKALATVADGARCNLASQQQAVVGGILETWNDELVRRATAGAGTSGGPGPPEPVEPLLVAETLDLADGEVAVDVRHRAKRPDWTYDGDWSGTYPADSS
jgi:NADH:ubiquinone oxidoreductase subunit F (NADH-binding)